MNRPDSPSDPPRWGPRPPQHPPGQSYPYPPPPRRRRRWPWVLLGLLLLLLGGCAALFAVFVNEVSEEAARPARITYAATGTASGPVSLTYSTWRDGSLSTSQVGAATLPWSKELTTKGFVKGGSLVVTLGADGGTATCSVTVDDDPPVTATATGPFASAVCDGF
ncbi:hypothetical protein [Streptomyces sp. NBC_01264]|uniref:hypothetical protein n=1 Tax=Streptomyces sp. NBC_01264 TaxID=2903804 RepID=UPI00224CE8B0|nr:hypothetical protein [Streptomyces sp. NBC_01264]MCX4778540.1 hypothetical protein [Streptomyces sp. NBC_01264]